MQQELSIHDDNDHHTGSEKEMDTKLYDRQLYVLGADTLKRLHQSRVLICGLGGVGVEIAKNSILSGIGQVALYDDAMVSFDDLSSQFACREEDIGRNRAEVSHDRLKKLNEHVHVSVVSGPLSLDLIKTFTVVVTTDAYISDLVSLNEMCRNNGGAFLW